MRRIAVVVAVVGLVACSSADPDATLGPAGQGAAGAEQDDAQADEVGGTNGARPPSGAEPSTCNAGFTICGGACVPSADPAHGCGAADCEPCPAPANGAPICATTSGASTCAFTCDAGYVPEGDHCVDEALVARVSAGDPDRTGCAIKSDGTLACWGQAFAGAAQPPAGAFRQVSVGNWACAIRTSGELACWGASVQTPAGTFSQVEVGWYSACAVRTDGSAACFSMPSAFLPLPPPPAGTFREISVGYGFACGVKSDGSLACWGSNSFGQSSPPAGSFRQVSAGYEHACALASDGTVRCWGYKPSGAATPPSGTFRQVKAGNHYTCGLADSGALRCWGSPRHGLLAPPPGAYRAVSTGFDFACGIASDRTLRCWGNSAGPGGTGAGFGQTQPPAGDFW